MLSQMYTDLRVTYPLSWSGFKKLEFSRQIFRKIVIKYHGNLCCRSRDFLGGRTDRRSGRETDTQTDMTRLIVTSRNFAKAHKNTGCFRECFYDRR